MWKKANSQKNPKINFSPSKKNPLKRKKNNFYSLADDKKK